MTTPLDADLQLMGSVSVVVQVDAPDTDLYAVLYRPDAPPEEGGAEASMGVLGRLRARFRDGDDRPPRLLVPGRPAELKLTFGPVGHCLRTGERLALHLTSQLPGVTVRNNQTGEPIAGARRFQAVHQRILCGPGHASRVEIDVLP